MRSLPWNIVTKGRGQLLAVISEELCIKGSTRDGHVSHAAIEQVRRGQFRVYMNQRAIRSLSLARMTRRCIAVVGMRMLIRIDLERAARIHLQAQSPSFVNTLDCPPDP